MFGKPGKQEDFFKAVYRINERGIKKAERMILERTLQEEWIDDMDINEIRDWTSLLKESGLRFKLLNKFPVMNKDGIIIGETIGMMVYALKHNFYYTHHFIRQFSKNGKVLKEIIEEIKKR